jgi:hypothetical protein
VRRHLLLQRPGIVPTAVHADSFMDKEAVGQFIPRTTVYLFIIIKVITYIHLPLTVNTIVSSGTAE